MIPQTHQEKIHAFLNEHGACSTNSLISMLVGEWADCDADEIPEAVHSALNCPGTWRMQITDDTGLVGLDEQAKPGDGSQEAAAAYLGLVMTEMGYLSRHLLQLNETIPD